MSDEYEKNDSARPAVSNQSEASGGAHVEGATAVPTDAVPSAGGTEKIAARHYLFLCFLTLLNVMNFVDRQLLVSFSNYIKPELALSDTQWGLLTGLVFIFFYAVMGLFMGALADILHRPRLVAAGVALWSVLTAASGAAKGFVSLALPRMFIGVGESALTPTSMSMLSDRFPERLMGFASGFYYMGVPIGIGASMLVAGVLGPQIGWRNCFYLLGAMGVVMAVAMLFVKETPRRQAKGAGTGRAPELSATGLKHIAATVGQSLARSPALGLTIAGGVVLHFILGAAAFDQLWYVQERGFDRDYILLVTGQIAVVAGLAGNLFGGFASDWWQSKFGSGRPMFLFWVMIILTPLNVAYRLVDPDTLWFWLGVVAGFFSLGCFYGPTFSTIQELVPPSVRASVVGFYLLMLNLVGLGIGTTAAGFTVDVMRSNGVEDPYTKALLVFSLISAFSAPLFYLAGKRFERDKQRMLEAEGLV